MWLRGGAPQLVGWFGEFHGADFWAVDGLTVFTLAAGQALPASLSQWSGSAYIHGTPFDVSDRLYQFFYRRTSA